MVKIKKGNSIIEVPYFFGAPRSETSPAYAISKKLLSDKPFIKIDGKELWSPIHFKDSIEMHPEHGGNYTVAMLNKN